MAAPDTIPLACYNLADATGIPLEIDKAQHPWSIRGWSKRSLPFGLSSRPVSIEIVSSHILDLGIERSVHALARGPGHLSFFFQAGAKEVDLVIFDNSVRNARRSGFLEAMSGDYDPMRLLWPEAVRAVFKAVIPPSYTTGSRISWTRDTLADTGAAA